MIEVEKLFNFSTMGPLPASIQVRDNIGNLLQGVIISINGDSNFINQKRIYGYFSMSNTKEIYFKC